MSRPQLVNDVIIKCNSCDQEHTFERPEYNRTTNKETKNTTHIYTFSGTCKCKSIFDYVVKIIVDPEGKTVDTIHQMPEGFIFVQHPEF